jgi:5-methylcytosine-specific restriction protein B
MTQADEIRKYVLDHFIISARQQKVITVRIRAGDVHKAMELANKMPLVCAAIDADKFLDYARLTLVRRSGPQQGANAEWVFALK